MERLGPIPFLMAAVAHALVGAGAEVQAQARLLGRVVDDATGSAIEGVRVTVRGVDDRFLGQQVTGVDGGFDFSVRRVVAVRLYADRMGYRTTVVTPVLHFDGDDFFTLELRLHPEALLLAPLEVVARRSSGRSPVLAGFYDRLREGRGHYITRQEIERRRPMYVSDLLADVPGVRLETSGSGRGRVVTMARGGGRCAAEIFLDGVRLMRPVPGGAALAVDDVVVPTAVEGIEVHAGTGSLPAEFRTADGGCGAVAIWTRRADAPAPGAS